MNCRELKQHLGSEELLPAEAEEHLETCDACRELVEGDHRLPRGFGALERTEADDEAELDFDALRDDIEDERGVLASWRELSVAVRGGTIAAVACIVVAVIGFYVPRPDLPDYPTGRFWGLAVGFASVGALAGTLGLRPIHRPDPSRLATGAVLALVLEYNLTIGLLPPAHTVEPFYHLGRGANWIYLATRCFLYGAVYALPAFAVLRPERPKLRRSSLLAAGLGTVGHLGLHLNCPILASSHRLFGHAAVPFAYAGLCALLTYECDPVVYQRRPPRPRVAGEGVWEARGSLYSSPFPPGNPPRDDR